MSYDLKIDEMVGKEFVSVALVRSEDAFDRLRFTAADGSSYLFTYDQD